MVIVVPSRGLMTSSAISRDRPAMEGAMSSAVTGVPGGRSPASVARRSAIAESRLPIPIRNSAWVKRSPGLIASLEMSGRACIFSRIGRGKEGPRSGCAAACARPFHWLAAHSIELTDAASPTSMDQRIRIFFIGGEDACRSSPEAKQPTNSLRPRYRSPFLLRVASTDMAAVLRLRDSNCATCHATATSQSPAR